MDTGFHMFPERASRHAASVDRLTLAMLAVSVFFSVLIATLVVVFAIRYRRRAGVPTAAPPPAAKKGKAGMALEITWTVIPLILMVAMFFAGARMYVRIQQPPAGAMEINVVGKQWMWKLQHPTGAREINALHVPTGRPVRLIMISEDVIHDFGLPAFRLKQDVLPGRYTSEWFQADRPGEYHLFCDQYCGADHAKMVGTVYVREPSKYRQWLDGGPADLPPRDAGRQLFSEYGCITCHAARAPTMAGLYGRIVQLEGGCTVTADENYLRESILYPSARMVRGYPPIMPSYRGQLTEEQVMQLVAYIKSLADAAIDAVEIPGGGATTQPDRAIPGPFLSEQAPKTQR